MACARVSSVLDGSCYMLKMTIYHQWSAFGWYNHSVGYYGSGGSF